MSSPNNNRLIPQQHILPQEPDTQETKDRQQQQLDSERAAAFFEEEGVEEEGPEIDYPDDEEAENVQNFIGNIQRQIMAASVDVPALSGPDQQFALGEPNAPILINATVVLPPEMSMEVAGKEIGELVEKTVREDIAEGIENDFDEFVYIPLSLYTQKNKQKKGLAKPSTPLYGTGELVKQMRPGGWLDTIKKDGNQLQVSWGPTVQEDQQPSQKYRDQFFGNAGTGKGHKTKIPRRFPKVSNTINQQVTQVILDWLRTHQDAAATNDPDSRNPIFTA